MTSRPVADASLALHRRVRPFHRARVYEVGGAVRDRLLGLDSKDLDYVITGLPAESFPAVFMHDRVDHVGESFGVYKIQLREWGEPVTPVLDVALPRTERSTGPGHRDFEVKASHELSIEEDLARRDFTVNAIAYDVQEGEYIDPHGGLDDLRAGVLRFVGTPYQRIEEDPLRILRLVRFMAKLGFQPESTTHSAAVSYDRLLDTLAPERVFGELWGALSQARDAEALRRALTWLVRWGTIDRIIPEYAAAREFDQGTPYHHLSLADHMVEAVVHARGIGASPTTLLALLLHDLGKLHTRTEGEDGRCHYYGHEHLGAGLAAGILSRLRASLAVIQDVDTLIREHMRLSPRHPLSDRSLRRFMNDLGPLWRDSLDHRCADLLAHSPEAQAVDPAEWHAEMVARCEVFGGEVATFSDHALALSGAEIMTLLDLKPGKEVGRLKARLVQDVIDGEVPNERAALLARVQERYVPTP